jgi:hypothetical protein
MSYPGPSNWQTGGRTDGYWIEGRQLAQTNGWGLIATLQSVLREELGDNGRTTYDGSTVTSAELPILDRNDPASGVTPGVLRALWAFANARHAPQAMLDAIATDAASGAISDPLTLRAALWASYRDAIGRDGAVSHGAGSPDAITLPADTVMPRAGLPDFPTNGEENVEVLRIPIPANASLPALAPQYPGFQFNPWLVIAVLATAAAGLVILAKPVKPLTRARRNPRRARRSRR